MYAGFNESILSDPPLFESNFISTFFVCLFGGFHPTGDVTIAGEDLCSALITIEQWSFFSVSLVLWHGASVYNGHLRGPLILIPTAQRLVVELSLPVLTTKVCRGRESNTQFSACEANGLDHCAPAVVILT